MKRTLITWNKAGLKNRFCFGVIPVLLALLLNTFALCSAESGSESETGSAAVPKAEKTLSLSMPSYGMIRFEGDFTAGDRIRLYHREYRSAENAVIDQLLIDTEAESDGDVTIGYSEYNAISAERITPDFTYEGSEVVIKALYGVVSEGDSEIRSSLFYTECFMETSVINQFYSTYHGSAACGPAAGVIVIQPVYPASGIEMYDRMNVMRDYCMDGDDYCTGEPKYETVGSHITNTVNRYIREELSGTMFLSDHRTADKTMEETLIGLLSTGRPAIVEVCYLRGSVTQDFWGISHWIVVNGFFMVGNKYWFRYSDPVTVSYIGISSDFLDASNRNVSYGDLPYTPDGYIGAFTDPLFSIE